MQAWVSFWALDHVEDVDCPCPMGLARKPRAWQSATGLERLDVSWSMSQHGHLPVASR